uniref:Uncharacterized protein n=1 Tax=Tetranychus urticae TaxID=32264 RepID=T1K765_TETUR
MPLIVINRHLLSFFRLIFPLEGINNG